MMRLDNATSRHTLTVVRLDGPVLLIRSSIKNDAVELTGL